jgi:hypothetical protein
MKKFLQFAAALLVILLAAFFLVVPAVVDSAFNRVNRTAAAPPSQAALALHENLRIVDLHADALLWGRDLLKRNDRGAVDLPRLLDGNVALAAFTAVTKTPRGLNYERNDASSDNIFWLALSQRWPARTWGSLTERALYLARRFDRAVAESHGTLVPIRSTRSWAKTLCASSARTFRIEAAISPCVAVQVRYEALMRTYSAVKSQV